MPAQEFTVRFWGARGSIACPGIDTLRYGGNTACLEVRCGPHLLIFDGGSGLRQLGRHLDTMGRIEADIFFSHTHLDHIVGLPFFSTIYNADNTFRLHAGHLKPAHDLRSVLREMMKAPLFPIPIDFLAAAVRYDDFAAGATLQPRPGVTIRTAPLNHPNGATGYCVEFDGRVFCYVTDTEHAPGRPDRNILDLVQDADVFVYDCTYTDEEFSRYVGWGHSTWQEGVRLADAAKAKTLVIFHHDPGHDDEFMDQVAAEASRARPGTVVAHEGMILRL